MPAAPTAPTKGSAEAAVAFLTEMTPDLRGAAILDADGAVLAASGDDGDWGQAARALLAAADRADSEPAEQAHVATEKGEAFLLRLDGLVAVAVSERFALASLLFFDMRQVLRDLALGRPPGGEPPTGEG
jgi:predicted regulator of Ras-like GTPase activity (Roadblock/LC7/MglB family)